MKQVAPLLYALLCVLLPLWSSATGVVVTPDEQKAALKHAVGAILDLKNTTSDGA